MKNLSEGKYVAMTRCYFCGGDNAILLHQRFEDVSDLHEKVVDMTPCSNCKENMKENVMLIAIDEEKSPEGWQKAPMPNPYRTGLMAVIKEEAFQKTFANNEQAVEFGLRFRWIFVDHRVMEQLGIKEPEDTP